MLRLVSIRFLLPLLLLFFADRKSVFSDELGDLRQMLGRDFDGAKFVARQGKDLVMVDVSTMKVNKLGSFPGGGKFDGLSRPWWSADGRQIVFSHGGKGYVMDANGQNRRRILEDRKSVYEPNWWDDPKTGERCFVFKTSNGKHWYRGKPSNGETLLYRPKSGRYEKLAHFPCDGGLSRDGTHLGEAYGGCLIVEVVNQKYHVLNRGRQACNPSMSPDNTYRLMHLNLPHDFFDIRDKFDKQLWRITKPKDTKEWQTPRWSNHRNFCMATLAPGYYPVIVQIDSKKIVQLKRLGNDWGPLHLWLPSAAASPKENRSQAGTLAAALAPLKLARYASYRKRLAGAQCVTPVLAELKGRKGDAEAKSIVDTVERFGAQQWSTARRLDNAFAIQAEMRKLAAVFQGHPIGTRARQLLDSPAFQAELAAAGELSELNELENRLRQPPKGPPRYENPDFMRLNQATLVLMSQQATRLMTGHAGTLAAKSTAKVIDKYGLPANTSDKGNKRLIVDATVEHASRVPSAQQIKPYTEAVTYVYYKLNRVIEGDYNEPKICVVHWGMRNSKPTAAANWKPGLRQQLKVDLFDFHRELHKITAADDAVILDTTPFWALKVDESQPLFAVRKWIDNTGRYSINAIYIQQQQKTVVLRRSDGRVVSVLISRLSNADQQYLRSLIDGTE